MAGLLGSTALLLVPIDGLSSGTFGMSAAFSLEGLASS